MQSTRALVVLAFAQLVLGGIAFGQALPQFEVASVKPAPPGSDFHVDLGIHIDGAQVSCNFFSLADLIRTAYDLKQYQVISPEWMASERYNLKATIPEGGKASQVRDMIKSLLAERFHLKVHKESKEFPVYTLEVAKGGAHLKQSELDETDGKSVANVTASGGPQGVSINLGRGAFFTFADNKLEAQKLDMTRFAELLARFMDRPVVDKTELNGNYDFVLKMSDEDYNAMRIRSAISAGVVLPPQAMKLLELSSGDSLHSALQAVGLRLEPRKAPLEVLVVESADKVPTEN